MKKIILPVAILATLFVSMAFTGSKVCSENDFFIKGLVAKMGYYKADGTQTGTGTSTVSEITNSGDSTIATILTSYEDASNKNQNHDGSMRMICLGDKIIMDMSSMLNSLPLHGGNNNMKMVMSGNFVPYATSYTAGQKLEDIHMKSETYNNGSLMMTMNISVTNRVVEAVEDRKTPAGTFHCYKISQTTSSESVMGTRVMPAGQPMKSVQWFSPKAGMIRMEHYKDDKVYSYNELLSIVRP